MTATDERQTLADFADGSGWHRRDVDRSDYYSKGGARVQVLWSGANIAGGSLYHDDILTAYSRDLSTIQGWLRR